MEKRLEEKAIEDLCLYEDVLELSLCAKSRMTGQPVYKETDLPEKYQAMLYGLKIADNAIQSGLNECSDIAGDEESLTRDKVEAEIMGEAYAQALTSVRSAMINLLYTVLDEIDGGVVC